MCHNSPPRKHINYQDKNNKHAICSVHVYTFVALVLTFLYMCYFLFVPREGQVSPNIWQSDRSCIFGHFSALYICFAFDLILCPFCGTDTLRNWMLCKMNIIFWTHLILRRTVAAGFPIILFYRIRCELMTDHKLFLAL